MQIKLEQYKKWYNRKKNHNIANIHILNVLNNNDLSKLYKIFNEIITNGNILLNFSSRHEFDDETIISQNIETLINYISNNSGNLEFIYKHSTFWLDGIAQLQKQEISEIIFEKICNMFEGITFFNSNSQLDYNDLKKLLESNKKVYIHKYLINNDLVNEIFTFSNDGLSAYISFNSNNIDPNELLDRIKLIMDID